MTVQQKEKIQFMREQGLSFSQIAQEVGLSPNTVKSFFRRAGQPTMRTSEASENKEKREKIEHQGEKADDSRCKCCGAFLEQTPKHKRRQFCDEQCRNKWWNSNRMNMPKRKVITIQCEGCGRRFAGYGSTGRKYCCHACYVRVRFGKEA